MELRSYVSAPVLVIEKAVGIELDKAVVNHAAKTIVKVKGCLDALEIDAGLLASDEAAYLLDRAEIIPRTLPDASNLLFYNAGIR